MKKLLITGGNGQVAYELVQLLREQNIAYIAPTREELNITEETAVNEAIEHFKPDAVINAAAYTKVDLAEKESELAYAVNSEGPKYLARASAKLKCALLHISTDYVFDGMKKTPYLETDPTMPRNIYGLSKRQGEIAVEEHCDHAIILRVSGVFGVHGNNFVKTILRLAKEREILRIVSDQIICPTPARAIAETILQMLSQGQRGTYHYCGAKVTNWHAFTQVIVQKALEANHTLSVKKIEAITTADYPTAAIRPCYSVLNCQRIKDIFGIEQPDWEKGLENVIHSLSTT